MATPSMPGAQRADNHLNTQKDQADTLANDSMGPRDSGPKQYNGNKTAKTPEDSPTDKQEGNAITLLKSPTSKLGLHTKTMILPADHLNAADIKHKHRYPIAMYNENDKENQHAGNPYSTEPPPRTQSHPAQP